MLKEIEFLDDIFNKEDGNNVMCELTDNTIIICSDLRVKNIILKHIIECFESSDYENCDYNYEDGDRIFIEVSYKPTSIVNISNIDNVCPMQRITITKEVPFILQAKTSDDIWFVNYKKYYNDKSKNKSGISIYPFSIFKGYIDIWNEGIMNVYKQTINGKFGNFGVCDYD